MRKMKKPLLHHVQHVSVHFRIASSVCLDTTDTAPIKKKQLPLFTLKHPDENEKKNVQ